MLDYATRVFWVTKRTRSIFGFAPDEVITMERFEAAVHPDDLGLVREVIARSAQAGEGPVNVDYRIVLPGEHGERWVSSRGRPHVTSTGEPDRLTGVTIDISERKHAEGALRASEARLASGAELSPAWPSTKWTSTPARCTRTTGCATSAESLHDRIAGLGVLDFWMEHVHPDDGPRVAELRRQMHEGVQERLSIEYRYLHPDGKELWIQHLAGAAVRDAGGRAVRTVRRPPRRDRSQEG